MEDSLSAHHLILLIDQQFDSSASNTFITLEDFAIFPIVADFTFSPWKVCYG